jgi:ABC-2 type transport system ATP-binding protein
MDPLSAKQVRDAIIELQRDERTFLITTHNLTEAQALANKITIIRRGRIIASGSFEELSRQFNSDTLVELKVTNELNGATQELGEVVTIVEHGTDWLRYRTNDPRTTNPDVVKRALGLGLGIISLTPLTQSLEDIYLQVVKEDEAQEQQS